jgi:hypothetical protein
MANTLNCTSCGGNHYGSAACPMPSSSAVAIGPKPDEPDERTLIEVIDGCQADLVAYRGRFYSPNPETWGRVLEYARSAALAGFGMPPAEKDQKPCPTSPR